MKVINTSSFFIIFILVELTSCKTDPKEKYKEARMIGDKKDYVKAVQVLDEIISDNPRFVPAYVTKSAYLTSIPGNESRAIEAVTMAIEIDSMCQECYWWRGTITSGTRALMDLNKAIELDDMDYQCFLSRGNLRIMLDDLFGAIDDFTKAVELSSNSNEKERAISQRTTVLLMLGYLERAKIDIDESIKLDSMDATNYYNMFVYRALNGPNKELAIKDFEKSIKLGLDSVLIGLGNRLIQKRDSINKNNWQEKVIFSYPYWESAQFD
jgi:tetratricopeptide (TPR) repeat protein